MKIFLSSIISVLTGFLVWKYSKALVENEMEFEGKYRVPAYVLSMIMFILNMIIFLRFELYLAIKIWLLCVVLLLTAIVDFYTHYVYLKPTLLFYFFMIMCLILLKDNIHIAHSIFVAINFSIIAFFSGKWYGDVQIIALITLVLGIRATLLILLLACFMALIFLVVKRNKKKEMAFCPMIFLSFIIFILIR